MLPQNNKNKLDKTHVYGHQSTGLSFRQYRTGSWYAVGREMSTVFLFMLSRSAFIFCGEVGWMIICLSMSLLSLCSCVVCLHIFLNKRFQIICRIKNRIKYLFTIKLKCPVHNWVKRVREPWVFVCINMSILIRSGFNLKRRVLNVYSCNYPIVTLFRCKSETMKYLNVAEKNDAAKNIALQLSRGSSRRVRF